jgi:hypothetical protein
MTGVISMIATFRRAAPVAAAMWRLSHRLLGPRWAKVALLAVGTGAIVLAANRRRIPPTKGGGDVARLDG